MEEALHRLREVLGEVPDWTILTQFLPDDLDDDLMRRSAVAALLRRAASARTGRRSRRAYPAA